MKIKIHLICFSLIIAFSSCEEKEEYIELFNGKDLTGWKANENTDCFKVEDGLIVANGERSHLYYVGNGKDAIFKNFELIAQIKTKKLANSGVYFHVNWEDAGWPSTGLEAQVNASHIGAGDYREFKKTGSLYGVRNLYKSYASDDEWYTMRILVEGRRVRVFLNDMKTVDYVVPVNNERFGQGMFALQGHDLESTVYFKSVKVKRLPDDLKSSSVPDVDPYARIMEYAGKQYPFIDLNVTATDTSELMTYLDVFYQSGVNLGMVDSGQMDLSQYPVFREGKDYTLGLLEGGYDELMGGLNMRKFNIWANPGMISEFTEDQKREVLTAVIENKLVIAISCKDQSPSLDVISLAKQMGCKFATIDILDSSGRVNVDYYLQMIDEAKLSYKDIYIPQTNEY